MKRELIYKGFERLWHWTQAALIIMLGITGFEIHGSIKVFGFEKAHDLHTLLAWALIVLIVFAIFWHITTGEWRQYIPSTGKRTMIHYYMVGIFKNEPHPIRKTVHSKLNPLQKVTYLGFKILIIPVQVSTGLLYLYYNNWSQWGITGISLNLVATIHLIGSFALLMFLIIHVYMTTTGHTPLANIKAMITGWEDLESEEEAKGH
jgi:thiosulfate reductase cytochrome b subunit